MSFDEDIEDEISDLFLINILNTREDAVSTSEIWAILKETCLALKSMGVEEELKNFKININCLMIDSSGNIQIDSNQILHSSSNCLSNKSLLKSIGQTMMYIMKNYSNVDKSEPLYLFLTKLINAADGDDNNNEFSLHQIELYSDRQLNGSSVDAFHDYSADNTKMDEYSSEFQDSFLSTEYSLNSYLDTDSEKSICFTKENDIFSNTTESFSSTDSKQGFLSLSNLWSYCLEPILLNDQECMVLIYAILKAISNSLLNESNYKKCLCISIENILLDCKGKIFLHFPSDPCAECILKKSDVNFYDIKYIIDVGKIVYEIIKSDHRITVSSYVMSILQRMIDCQDMIINDVLNFCKIHITLQGIKSRPMLVSLFARWKFGYNVNLHRLTNLKHAFLYDISTKNLNKFLKKTTTKSPSDIHKIFKKSPLLLSGLKYVTQISETQRQTLDSNRNKLIQPSRASAFQPYNSKSKTYSATVLNSYKLSKLKDNTHFKPLILSSECNSLYKSQDNIVSPIGVAPKYSNQELCCSYNKSEIQLNAKKNWQSVSHLSLDDRNESSNHISSKDQLSINRSTNDNSLNLHSLTVAQSSRSLKINTIIDIIQSSLTIHLESNDDLADDRRILTIADFALSLETLTENVFSEALKQRFPHIQWPEKSLLLLHDIINDRGHDMINKQNMIAIDINNNEIDSKLNQKLNLNKLPITINNIKSPLKFYKLKKNFFFHKNIKIPSGVQINEEKIRPKNEETESDCDINDVAISPKITKPTNTNFRRNNSAIFLTPKSPAISGRRLIDSINSNKAKSQRIKTRKHLEDCTFYEAVYPSTLLCFPASAVILNPERNPLVDFSINANNIKDLLSKFFQLNQSIQLKFRELTKTIDLIEKSREIKDKKLKKQYNNDRNDLKQNLESMFVNQTETEILISEYHSVPIERITEEIDSHCGEQSIRYANNVKNYRNLQMIQPYALVVCLFSKGAFTSGLVYEFFLIYREFYTPAELVSILSNVFNKLQSKLNSVQLTNARFRLLFIILCWIDGFYKVDFSNLVYSKVVNLLNKQLVPYLKGCNKLIENTINRSSNGHYPHLLFQYTSQKEGNHAKMDMIRKLDIEKAARTIEKNRKDKQKLFLLFNLNFEKSKRTSNEDIFSIFDISPKDLAMCFTLMEQNLFNKVHPCHLLLYINSLSCTDESILQVIKSHRFSSQHSVNEEISHKEVMETLNLSGKITHWAISEILRTTDLKLQGKIVKVLVVTCFWCVELNNYSTTMSILEAIHSSTLKWAPFWAHVTPKTIKTLKDMEDLTNEFSRNPLQYPFNDKQLQRSFLNGSPFMPCLHSMLVSLKLSLVGKFVTKDGCLKWNKLKKICDILDQIRLYSQFKYSSNNSALEELINKLNLRIDHLTSISLDILQSHNMLAQES